MLPNTRTEVEHFMCYEPDGTVILEKLAVVTQLANESPEISGTRSFITLFTTVRHFPPYPEPD